MTIVRCVRVYTRSLGTERFRPRDALGAPASPDIMIFNHHQWHQSLLSILHPHSVPLKSHLAASQKSLLLKIPGLPILAALSCQDDSIPNALSIDPSLGTTHRRRHSY